MILRSSTPGFIISDARSDGELFGRNHHARLERHHLDLTNWCYREAMEGGIVRWR
jgi:hypothetical protein